MSEIIKLIEKTLNVDTIDENAKIEDVLTDSLDIIELIGVLSNAYNIAVRPDALINVKTFGDIVKYVETHKNSRTSNDPLNKF